MIVILQAIILGIVEGLTEFLPISSTGHLIVAEKLIGYKDVAEIFTVVIQVGAIVAVVLYYRKDLWAKVTGLFDRDKTTMKFWLNMIIATIPAGLAGLAIEKKLSSLATLPVVAAALIIGGILIWLVESYHPIKRSGETAKFDELTPKQAIQVGFYQVLSLIPGVSRSGATIMGGLMSGLDRVTATAFSFYLSLPILFLASAYKIYKGQNDLASVSGGSTALIIGTVTTFIVAFGVISWLLRYIAKHNFKLFAYYRIILGVVILAAVLISK